MPKRQQVFFLNCIHLIWLHLYRSLLFWQTPKNSVNFLYLVLWLCGRKWQRGTQKSTKVISVISLIWFFHTGGCERAALRDFLKKNLLKCQGHSCMDWLSNGSGRLPVKFKKTNDANKNSPHTQNKQQQHKIASERLRITRKRER